MTVEGLSLWGLGFCILAILGAKDGCDAKSSLLGLGLTLACLIYIFNSPGHRSDTSSWRFGRIQNLGGGGGGVGFRMFSL